MIARLNENHPDYCKNSTYIYLICNFEQRRVYVSLKRFYIIHACISGVREGLIRIQRENNDTRPARREDASAPPTSGRMWAALFVSVD